MSTLSFTSNEHRLLTSAKAPRPGVRLLELDASILDDICNGSVVIKGEPSAEAVLCTAQSTYAVKIVETTNSLLLVPPAQSPDITSSHPGTDAQNNADAENTSGNVSPAPAFQTQAMKSGAALNPIAACPATASHLELVQIAPRLQRLDALLQASMYGEEDVDPENEAAVTSDKMTYSFDEMLSEVQASPAELQQALTDRHAVELDGAWRTVDKSYMESLLETALFLAIQQGWSYTALPQQDLVEGLQANGHDARLVHHFLSVYAQQQSEGIWSLKEPMVCAVFAESLLQSKPKWQQEEFLDAWLNSIPQGMTPDLSMLRGMAVKEDTGTQKLVKLFNVQQLPCEPAARFKAVFLERAQWSWQDLQPYVEDLQGPGRSAEALLLKYARRVQQDPGKPVMYNLISGRTIGADGPAPPGRRLHQLQPNAAQTTVGDIQTAEDQANADVADRLADDALDVVSGRSNGYDDTNSLGRKLQSGEVQTLGDNVQTLEDEANADVADTLIDDVLDLASGRTNGADGPAHPGRKLLQAGEVQTLGDNLQTLEDEANADVADTLIDDALDVGSGRSNGADGTPGNPDGGAAPSGTNAGAVNPPPGSG
ncbi:hypothetical protein WJX82_005403 [Trebouxia sp. C0006]